MRAVVSASLGEPPSLADVETPIAGSGEVRVKVHTSSLNGFDTAVVAGWMATFMEHRFPVVLGCDFSGTVDQVGDGVEGLEPGSAVFGVVLTMPLQAGGFGEYVVVPQASVARVPDGLDLTTAGVLGLASAAASGVIDAVDPQPGETMLVVGATGGVGTIIVQLAVARGVTIIATASRDTGADLVKTLGAHHVIDYTEDLLTQVHTLAANGVDIAVHLAGDPFGIADLVTPAAASPRCSASPRSSSASATSPRIRSLPSRTRRCWNASPVTWPVDGWRSRCSAHISSTRYLRHSPISRAARWASSP